MALSPDNEREREPYGKEHQREMELTRKDMLKLSLLGGAALMLPLERTARTKLSITDRIPESQIPKPFQVPFSTPPVLKPVRSDATQDYYQITMKAAQVQILPGFPKTTIYGYNGIAPGPTLRTMKGRPIVVRHINALPKVSQFNYPTWTSVHLHSSASLPQYDGYASDVTMPGEFKDYHFPNIQPARTMWYHDHGVHHTAQNAYMGLAAQYHLHDEEELSLPIPNDRYDVPLIIQDKIFAQNGNFIFDDQGESSIYGDVILVNGRPWPVMKVERRKYRFRVLNAGVSRSYRLALSTGDPFTFIACDGGLMPTPQQSNDFRIGMAERYEIVIDFSKYKVGEKIILKNLGLPNNQDYASTENVMMFEVASEPTSLANNSIPDVLNSGLDEYDPMKFTDADALRTRTMRFERKNGEWTINGATWENVIESDYNFSLANPGFNDIEIWELVNDSGGWFHPVHIHLIDAKILDRNGQAPFPYEKGPKDVFYTGEGEKVRVIMKFGPQRGRYMFHCHNLVHEDHDMMNQFWVDDPNGDHPVLAAPARPISEMKPL
jgi:spore coat protein A, manganese oxidase